MTDIRMRDLYKHFGDVKTIEKVNLDIEDGEFCVFVGPSGCGKSTLLRLVAGLEDVTSGELSIGGQKVNDVHASKRGVAMVFQSYALYPHMTIYDNMAFGLKVDPASGESVDDRVRWAAKILQMEHLLGRLPKQLSGGQRQRVAIGRAIVRKPGVFLFDEPLSNLDASLRVQTRIEIAKLHRSMTASMIYVTHDQVEAMTLADKIVLLNAGKAVLEEGSLAQVGPPMALYHHPVNLFVAGFIGSPKMNFLPGVIDTVDANMVTVKLVGGAVVRAAVDATTAKPGDKVTLGVRPEHTLIGEGGGDSVRGKVRYVEHLGESSFVYVTMEGVDSDVVVRVEGDTDAKIDDNLTLSLPAEACHVFNDKGRAFKRSIDPRAETRPRLS